MVRIALGVGWVEAAAGDRDRAVEPGSSIGGAESLAAVVFGLDIGRGHEAVGVA